MNVYLTRAWNLAVVASVLWPAALFGGVTEGGQIRACVHKNTGAVRIISANGTCNPQTESLLTWSIVGPRGGLRVVDSNETELGVPFCGNVVAREVDGGVWVDFFTSSFGIQQGVGFQYRSSDCSGSRYLPLGVSLPVDGFVVGTTIYYASSSSPETFSAGSAQFFDASGFHGCQPGNNTGLFGLAVEAPLPSFAPPFRVTDQPR
jgi:hypothetical protein